MTGMEKALTEAPAGGYCYCPSFAEDHVAFRIKWCGSSTDLKLLGARLLFANSTGAIAAAHRMRAADRMYEALQKIIDMNVQYCIDRYGDASEAEAMACVSTARASLASAEAKV